MSEQEKNLKSIIEKAPAQVASPKAPATPEQKPEQSETHFSEQAKTAIPAATALTESIVAVASPEAEREAEIERILEEDLQSTYFNLPEDKKVEFREQGEKTAWAINQLLLATKIKVKKIISLIRNWLLIIPGVNKFFLEQEAKIKADKIIRLKDKF